MNKHSSDCRGKRRHLLSIEERFWARVEKSPFCWNWMGAYGGGGYGIFCPEYKKPHQAHRWLFERARVAIPAGFQLDHLCRNRKCVRPDHLEIVTARTNVLRGAGITALNAAKTHCPSGHLYDERNTHIRPDGKRRCRACGRDYARIKRKRIWQSP